MKLCTPLLPTRDIFAHCGHDFRTSMTSFTIQVIINNRASTSDFPHGTHLTTLVRLIRIFYDVNTHAVANYFGDVMPSSNPRFTTGSDPILTGEVRNSDAIPVEETFTHATPFSHGDRSTASQLASVLYGDTRNAQRGDLSFPSSERFRAVSRSPRRGGFLGQR